MEKRFDAALSRSQGRNSWSVIFRHPVRIDPNTGKVGVRVRQGLGTADEREADQLKDQLNQLLAEESYWNLSAKSDAEKRFHRRVVEIFFYGMEPEENGFGSIRESIITLPISQNSEYRRALLLGTTGAGKTTLLRQLIGTDPESERFPSTSTAKTTVHETEVVMAAGPFRAAVTFFPVDEVRRLWLPEARDSCSEWSWSERWRPRSSTRSTLARCNGISTRGAPPSAIHQAV